MQPIALKVVLGMLCLAFIVVGFYAGIYPIYEQIRIERVIEWGQIGTWIVTALGFVVSTAIYIVVTRVELKGVIKELRDYVTSQNKFNDEQKEWNERQQEWNDEVREKLGDHGERISHLEGPLQSPLPRRR